MEQIEFQGVSYPLRSVVMEFGERTIGSVKLNDVLINDDGSYFSEEARAIDEMIFYFVAEKSLGMKENILVEEIMSEI